MPTSPLMVYLKPASLTITKTIGFFLEILVQKLFLDFHPQFVNGIAYGIDVAQNRNPDIAVIVNRITGKIQGRTHVVRLPFVGGIEYGCQFGVVCLDGDLSARR